MEEVVDEWKQLSAEELVAKRDRIEAKILAHSAELERQGGVGMQGRLVDHEGFPRADIDVLAVRTARHEIICLRNDHKAVMSLIEQKLHEIHSEARRHKSELAPEVVGVAKELPKAFVRVTMVTEGSPSALAGLRVGDSIAAFGSVTAANFTGLSSIASSTADGLETWSVQASPPITHTPTLARTRPARLFNSSPLALEGS